MSEKSVQDKTIDKNELKRMLDEALPVSIRSIIVELENDPLLQNMGEYLIQVPMREKVDKVKLITDVCERTKQDFFRVKNALKKMEEKGFVYVEEGSSSNYYLSPVFGDALELKRKIDEELNPLLKEIREDPDLGKVKDIEKRIKDVIYSTLFPP
ncbi:MAG: hypothetical protein QME50_06565 [Candidatus Bathyarchaeota archaeon]|nr:hypothetical protein [Candidatus Bathyarchaeota archaeon]MDI6798976.1 hypothetical protein [Candidatus Aenigmarchaeota archaeon]